ncbi:nucleoside hydrolase [Bifidobacterium adolescentis]|uniref:nucleoside hydrolase n=1 Tax=Bifidobacterium adolescentis TaxID=1680 RepID=UPI0023EAF7A4|nr:nucleoside hydrolase [Bifidobacterium adolescentis]MDF4073379.1 nucleoside hydrolase [Bifidobacterium adolescentis]
MTSTPCSGNRKLILDVDTGIDDALALAYLASFNEVDLLGIIGTYGNVVADTAVRNTRYVLDRLGLHHVPAMAGSTHPSWADSFIADAGCAQFHGVDGLGGFGPVADSSVPDSVVVNAIPSDCQTCSDGICASEAGTCTSAVRRLISVGGYDVHDPHANPSTDSFALSFAMGDRAMRADTVHSPALPEGVRFIIDTIRRFGSDVTVVATGPLTDIAAAIDAAPDIASSLQLVMMGGTLTQEGNCWDATAETNIIQDPEAADRVFHSEADTTMVGLDVTHQCLLGRAATAGWRGTELGDFLADMADFSIEANAKADARLFAKGMPLHDPLAAAVAIDPGLVGCFDLPMKVETQTGDFHGTRGRTIGDPAGLIDPSAPRVHVALTVDHNRFVADFAHRIAHMVAARA